MYGWNETATGGLNSQWNESATTGLLTTLASTTANNAPNLTETITVSGAIQIGVKRRVADSASTSETIKRAITKMVREAVNLTPALSRAAVLALGITASTSVTDAAHRGMQRDAAVSAAISEAIAKHKDAVGRLSETPTLTIVMKAGITVYIKSAEDVAVDVRLLDGRHRVPASRMSVADVANAALAVPITDTATVTTGLRKAVNRHLASSATFVSFVVSSALRRPLEVINIRLTDDLGIDVAAKLTDASAVSDAVKGVYGQLRDVASALSVSVGDIRHRSGKHLRELVEALGDPTNVVHKYLSSPVMAVSDAVHIGRAGNLTAAFRVSGERIKKHIGKRVPEAVMLRVELAKSAGFYRLFTSVATAIIATVAAFPVRYTQRIFHHGGSGEARLFARGITGLSHSSRGSGSTRSSYRSTGRAGAASLSRRRVGETRTRRGGGGGTA